MTEENTAYNRYCKENDEQWEKEKQIKVTIPNYNMIHYFRGYGTSIYLSKIASAIKFNSSSNKKY